MFLGAQLLSGREKLLSSKDGAAQVIDKLGYVQIDSIGVVDRAQNLTLWNRMPGFKSKWLLDLQREGRIYEYWGHALSYMPIADFRYSLPLMKKRYDPVDKWEKKRKYGYYVMPILWEGNLVGRFDPKADRKAGKLVINNIFFEPGFKRSARFNKAFDRKIAELEEFTLNSKPTTHNP